MFAQRRSGILSEARRRRRRRRALTIAAVGVATVVAAVPFAKRHHSPLQHPRSTAVVRRLSAGRRRATFRLRERAGVVLLAQVSAPRGVRATVLARIPGVAGVTFTTEPGPRSRNPDCTTHGATRTCTEAVEWCPMPQATWRVTLAKSAGPAGAIRVSFVVGPKPRANADTTAQ